MTARASGTKPLNTLAIDIGGTGIKASVLDERGQMEHDRVRVATPYPLSPQKLVLELQKLIGQLPAFDRVSVGFPGMVRAGQILSAPHFISPSGPGGRPEPKLVKAWNRFDLAAALAEVTGKPTKVANDADLQGAAVVEGKGFEAVVTLGTGVGTAFFLDGRLLPHFEFAHTPLSKGGSYNDVLGEATRKRIGNKKWAKRALDAIETLRGVTFFDHCYVGGGNAPRLGSNLPDEVSLVDNSAGILGGIKLWDRTDVPSSPVRQTARAGRSATARASSSRPPTSGTAPSRARTPAKTTDAAGATAPAKKTTARKTAARPSGAPTTDAPPPPNAESHRTGWRPADADG
jgi:polyphosphate glucokinase